MANLPKLSIPVTITNPDWVKDGDAPYYIKVVKEVEILQLNLSTGGMRVRYSVDVKGSDKPRVVTVDVSADAFFDKFSIVER